MGKQISIKMSEKAKKELKELEKKLDVKSLKTPIRAAMSLTTFLTKQKEKGNELIIRSVNSNKESRVLTLS
jgi:hypothetical protein